MFRNQFLSIIQRFKQTHRRSYPLFLRKSLCFYKLGIKRKQLSEYTDIEMYHCAENLLIEIEWHTHNHRGLKKFHSDLTHFLSQFSIQDQSIHHFGQERAIQDCRYAQASINH